MFIYLKGKNTPYVPGEYVPEVQILQADVPGNASVKKAP
jgi:hypothetical protein